MARYPSIRRRRHPLAIAKSSRDIAQAQALVRKAIALQRDYWLAYDMLALLQNNAGDEEGAVKTAEELRKAAGGRRGKAPETAYEAADIDLWDLPALLHGIVADAESTSGVGTYTVSTGPVVALLEAQRHDPMEAEFALQTTKSDPSDPTIAATTHAARGILASESGDLENAVSEWEAFYADYASPIVMWTNYGLNCAVALAEEAAGHPDKADAVLKSGGTFVDCYRFRGDIMDHRGNWQGAQKAYADAVALAPDLPAAYYSWGVALARHADLAEAETKLKEANQRGPHWADPLKAWGDVLVKQGKTREALRKYGEALQYAPNWRQLREAREGAAKQKS